MAIHEINTEGVGRLTAQQFIKSYEILKSEYKVEIEDNSDIGKHIYNALVELRVISYDFRIKDIVKLTLNRRYCYILYIEITVPYNYNPGSLDATHELDQCVVLGYAKLNEAYGDFIVAPKTGVDKTRTSFNKIFGKGLLKSNKKDDLFYDNYLIQGDKEAFERFASDETKKEMLNLKNFSFFVKEDILIAGMIEIFKIENVVGLSNFFKTIPGSVVSAPTNRDSEN